MSDVKISMRRVKGMKTVTLRFKGKLSQASWAAFKAKLKQVVGHHGLEIHAPRKTKKRAKRR